MSSLPHYLRFVRSIGMVGTLAMAACGDDKTTPQDTSSTSDTVTSDSTDTADTAAVDCDACDCQGDASSSCQEACCFAVGPLYPPDLPA